MGGQTAARDEDPLYPPIGDYGLIGNCRSAALVSRDGSVDWLCLPDFADPSVFAAILDSRHGGRFRIRPRGVRRVRRRYSDHTNVLLTTFETDQGVVRVTDCMPVHAPDAGGTVAQPERELLRRVEVLEGTVELEVLYEPRPDYGRRPPHIEARGKLGWFVGHGGEALVLRCDRPLRLADDRSRLTADLSLAAGERCYFSLGYSRGDVAVLPMLGEAAEERLAATETFWRSWSDICKSTYDGPYRDAVIRSILTLKLMDYSLSGAVIAAPTSSLPEWPGGVRNWDYRYCWLRDTAFTLRAFMDLGYYAEGRNFLGWLLHSTRLTWPHLHVLYTVMGEVHIPERELSHLEGYRGARPVRIGNGAYNQLQMDVYGEVVLAAYDFVRRGGRLDRHTARLLRGLGRTVLREWQRPDRGIWEVRGEPRHYTYSKLMCWAALDRLIKLHEAGYAQMPVQAFRRSAKALRRAIEDKAYNRRLQAYVGVIDGDERHADAALLLLSRVGFHDPAEPRLESTFHFLQERLSSDGLFYRYSDGFDEFAEPEGAFGICGFWAASWLATKGDVEAARRQFERILSCSNDLGLLGEEIDPSDDGVLGNFPQAFSHVGLIDAALCIARAERSERKEGRSANVG